MSILLVEDDISSRKSMKRFLEENGFCVKTAQNGIDALDIINNETQLIITDKRMPNLGGIGLLKEIRDRGINKPVIVVTAFGDIDSAVEAIKLGAAHYIQKPIHPDELLLKIKDIIERQELISEVNELRRELKRGNSFNSIIGNSSTMRRLFDKIALVAGTKSTVLIQGESGTGKELIAKAIHDCSPRKDMPFVVINCAAMPENLIESEIFGHVKGAFTGAIATKKGLFEIGNNGTLFIDEIGELKKELQAKLLRFIENKIVVKVGSTVEKSVDVRLIAATNRRLEDETKTGNFRSDLYYRLNVVRIDVPPLREHKEDIPLMIRAFVEEICMENRLPAKHVNMDVVNVLSNYVWPGNVRELRNFIEGVIVLSNKETITMDDIPDEIKIKSGEDKNGELFKVGMPLAQMEKNAIMQTLKKVNGNKSKTAQILKVSLRTIQRKIQEYDL